LGVGGLADPATYGDQSMQEALEFLHATIGVDAPEARE
jgi:hypothetical protein